LHSIVKNTPPRWLGSWWVEAAVLGGLVALAAAIRLFGLQFDEFKADDANALQLARDMVGGHSLPLVGIRASSGLDKGPLFIYLLAIPALFSDDPRFGLIAVALANAAAVALCYAFTRRYFGRPQAMVAAALYASGYALIFYSRRLVEPDLLAPFVMLWILAIFSLGVRRRPISFAWACLGLAALVQLEQANVALVPVLLVAAFFARRHLKLRHVALGLALFALAHATFVVHEIQTGFGSVEAVRHILGEPSRLNGDVLDVASWLVTPAPAGLVHYQIGPQRDGLFDGSPLIAAGNVAFWLTLIASAAWLGLRCLVAPQKERPRYVLLVCWILLPVLFYLRHQRDIYPYYILAVMPGPYVMVGGFFAAVGQTTRWRLGWRPRLGLAISLVLLVMATSTYAMVRTVDAAAAAPVAEGYNVPLSVTTRATAAAAAAGRRAGRITLQAEEPRRSALAYLIGDSVPLKIVGDGPGIAYRPGTVILVDDDQSPAGKYLAEHAAPLARVPFPADSGNYAVYDGDPERALGDERWREFAVEWENGLRLVAVDAPRRAAPGSSIRVSLAWQAEKAAPGDDPKFFVQVTDAEGRAIAQRDALGYPPADWDSAETVVTWYDLSLPAAAPPALYTIRAGMYTLPGPVRVPLRRPEAVDSVALSPIALRPSGTGAPIGGTNFGAQLRLAQFEVPRQSKPGAILRARLVWAADQRPPADYSVFVHLLDSRGNLVAQHDGMPDGGRYPTSLWAPGDAVADEHQLVLPADLAPGAYTLYAGLYDPRTGIRLPTPAGDEVTLGVVDIP
jgi:4-amino-4-deoxy-L-arabinose transferase-like glycosyltransferase